VKVLNCLSYNEIFKVDGKLINNFYICNQFVCKNYKNDLVFHNIRINRFLFPMIYHLIQIEHILYSDDWWGTLVQSTPTEKLPTFPFLKYKMHIFNHFFIEYKYLVTMAE